MINFLIYLLGIPVVYTIFKFFGDKLGFTVYDRPGANVSFSDKKKNSEIYLIWSVGWVIFVPTHILCVFIYKLKDLVRGKD